MKTKFRRGYAGSIRSKVLAALAVIGVVVTLAVLSIPRISCGPISAPMTQVLANMRSLQMATAAMTLDTLASGKDGLIWTSIRENGKLRPATLAEFFRGLTDQNYLSKSDLRQLLTAHGFPRLRDDVPLTAENIPFRIFWIDDQTPADQPLFVTRNWQDRQLTNAEPFGKKGFVFCKKGGGGGMSTNQNDDALSENFPEGRDAEGRAYRYEELR